MLMVFTGKDGHFYGLCMAMLVSGRVLLSKSNQPTLFFQQNLGWNLGTPSIGHLDEDLDPSPFQGSHNTS